MSYAQRSRRKRSMLDAELRAVLKVSGEHKDGFRDHVIISLAVGTGLREHEIAALDVGDITKDGRRLLRTIDLRVYKRSRHRELVPEPVGLGVPAGGLYEQIQRVRLPDATYDKLERYLHNLPRPRLPSMPLFVSGRGRRISLRRLRSLWRTWQQRAGIQSLYSFHELRHTAISRYRERTGDIRKAQLFARHSRLETTTIYDHPSDQELLDAVRGQPG
jgi:integrase/recombinase XerC